MVTSIGNGSISDAHTGVIPFRIAASGKPPMPSNMTFSMQLPN